MFEAKWKEKEVALTSTYQAQREEAKLVSRGNFSSERVRSSCGSTQLLEIDADSTFDMDHISEPTYCMLYMESQGCKAVFRHMVAANQVHLGNMINGHPLPPGYAIVILDTLAKEKYDTIELKMTMDDDRSTLAANMGSWVPWRKRNIVLTTTMSDCSSNKDVKLTNPRPTPALPPISKNEERPHKIRKISASNKETATNSNQKNLHCPSKKTTEME
jgi:hypothetical protein